MVGSSFYSPAESRYATIEGELAAIKWALQKTRIFTLGAKKLIICTDHKPLVSILKNVKSEIESIRILRLKNVIIDWKFHDVWYIKGGDNSGHDAQSRQGEQGSINLAQKCKISKLTVNEVQKSYESDKTMEKLVYLVKNGFPDKKTELLDDDLKTFWLFQNNLTYSRNMIFFGDRIVAPRLLRPEILCKLHVAHQGSHSMELRANKLWFWLGMSSDIEKFRSNCLSCNENQLSNSDLPPLPIEEPVYPFQNIYVDYCLYTGYRYGVMVCWFSGWPAVWKAKHISFST